MSVAERMVGKRICICTGSGGVGKTTTAAAVALGLAARGQRVAVVTIDPARRLAGSLGLDRLGNEPRLVEPAHFAGYGIELRGELWAMMLDAKRTFDELIELLAPDAATRDAIFANRIYQELSRRRRRLAGVHRCGQALRARRLRPLRRDHPRHATVTQRDGLPRRARAADRLPRGSRAEGDHRADRVAAAIAARGSGLVFSALRRITGVDLLADLSAFFGVLGGVVDGFAERASAVSRLLGDPATTFLIVTSPEPAPVEEAIFLRRRLSQAGMPFGGLIVNRVRVLAHNPPAIDESVLAAEFNGDRRLAARAMRALEDLRALARRDADCLGRLSAEFHDERRSSSRSSISMSAICLDSSRSSASSSLAPRERSALLAEQAF